MATYADVLAIANAAVPAGTYPTPNDEPAFAKLVRSAGELEDVQLDDEEIDQDEEPDVPHTPMTHSLESPSGKSTTATFVDLYDAMMNARVQRDDLTIPPWTELSFEGGRRFQGYLLFNEFRGTGRLVNPDREISIDFDIGEIVGVTWWE